MTMTPFTADQPIPPRPAPRRSARAVALADHQALPSDRQLASAMILAVLASLALWTVAVLLLSSL